MVGESSKHRHQTMHFITKVATITSMKVIMKDWLRKYRSKGQKVLCIQHHLFATNKQKNEKGKALCLFYDNEDYKDKLIAAVEYHSVRNNPNMKHMESLMENWKQMTMQLDELDVHAKPVLCRCSSF